MPFQPIPDSFAAIPLRALPAVVLDTETTGLNVKEDRIIEIGAIAIGPNIDVDNPVFNKLVRPGIAIPDSAFRIHGISDTDVGKAAEFGKIMPEFAAWAGARVVIGYSIGFDLAVFEAECARCGLKWVQPRSLDVRHLVQLAGVNLPEQSLEIVAEWLEIEIENRHRAFADAELTAKIFQALAPKLNERGIHTFGQAQRASRLLTVQLEEEAQAGWHDPAGSLVDGRSSVAEFARIDSYPYRHRVRDLMSSPPRIVRQDRSIRDVLQMMVKHEISSVFVEGPRAGATYGIITERDILRALSKSGTSALDNPVSDIATFPLLTISGNEFVYRALAGMSQRNFRHLGVVRFGWQADWRLECARPVVSARR